MEKVDHFSGTMEMGKVTIKLMLTGILDITRMEHNLILIKLYLNQ